MSATARTTTGAGGARGAAEVLRGGLVGPVKQAFKGGDDVVELAVVCLLSRGHLLVEGHPGSGKTTLAKAIAHALGAEWRRIQFTPDLLPSDVTGFEMPHLERGEPDIRLGPVFAHVVVADEINRASPRTQSALLEAMEERQVTLAGRRHRLPDPFLLIATQNPVDLHGTYALPEAQLDRFLVRVTVGHPAQDVEHAIAAGQLTAPEDLAPVLDPAAVRDAIARLEDVTASHALVDYAVRLARATRASGELLGGVSVRATSALVTAARARAFLHGRAYPTADDVQALAVPVLAHRVEPSPQARGDAAAVIRGIVERLPAPENAACDG